MATSLYRKNLPQLSRAIFLTDSGMETDFVFNRGFELPCFSTLPLLKDKTARAAMLDYYLAHAEVARAHGVGVIIESPSWRASKDWGVQLGYDDVALAAANRDAVALIAEARDKAALPSPFVLSANIGPRGDGYVPGELMTQKEAEDYHSFQVGVFANTEADLVTGMTITNTPEAIGIANAAAHGDMPSVISFTVETDGRLPSGQPLGEAIMETDFEAKRAPAYYMINCAHPTHFETTLRDGGPWLSRLRGIRANASKCSHAELDEAEVLDDGNPAELGGDYARIARLSSALTIFGGCCGTDIRHIAEIAESVAVKQKAA